MVKIGENEYELVENHKDGFDLEALKSRWTEYFDAYDYIVGDWAYGKLRLKGFSESKNKNHNSINDAGLIKKYIDNYCAYGCKYFIIKRIIVDNNTNM